MVGFGACKIKNAVVSGLIRDSKGMFGFGTGFVY